MYGKPIPPVTAAGALAATGIYAGSAVLIGIIALILGVVLVRVAYFRAAYVPRHARSTK